jgi:hypothetical protein
VKWRVEPAVVLEVLSFRHDGIVHGGRVLVMGGFAIGSEVWQSVLECM